MFFKANSPHTATAKPRQELGTTFSFEVILGLKICKPTDKTYGSFNKDPSRNGVWVSGSTCVGLHLGSGGGGFGRCQPGAR